MTKRKTGCAIAVIFASCVFGASACAGSLENLERERSRLIQTIVNDSLSPAQRYERLLSSQRKLVDLERMVIHDPRVTMQNTPIVRHAFNNYDLTFLVHAGIENKLTLTDQWLDHLGVTNAALMKARLGRR